MQKKAKIIGISVFLAVWAVIFALYLACVITKNQAYSFVILCLAFSLVIPLLRGDKWTLADLFLSISLCLTAFADIFMGFFGGDKNFIAVGVTIFCLVQFAYFACMTARRGGKAAFKDRHFKISLIVRAVAVVVINVVVLGIFFWGKPTFNQNAYLIIITGFYFVNAVVNLFYACVYIKQNPIAPAALLFLILCDTFLGLVFLGVFSGGGYLSRVDISWIFYLPSLALFAMSGMYKKNGCDMLNEKTDTPATNDLTDKPSEICDLSKADLDQN